jgi:hypothetical protein
MMAAQQRGPTVWNMCRLLSENSIKQQNERRRYAWMPRRSKQIPATGATGACRTLPPTLMATAERRFPIRRVSAGSRFVKDQPGAFRNENRRTCWIYFKPTRCRTHPAFTLVRHAVEWQREKSR